MVSPSVLKTAEMFLKDDQPINFIILINLVN